MIARADIKFNFKWYPVCVCVCVPLVGRMQLIIMQCNVN